MASNRPVDNESLGNCTPVLVRESSTIVALGVPTSEACTV